MSGSSVASSGSMAEKPAVKLTDRFISRLVNGILAIKPLATLAKNRAREMMIQRAETIGVYWRQEVENLSRRGTDASLAPDWETELAQITDPQLNYPDYYLCSFHAYAEGNLGWQPALEVEVAAHAVHARIWPDAGAQGDARLRQSYHDRLQAQITGPIQTIADLGCSVGMSTFALQAAFPHAQVTGIDLSPHFLTVAQYRDRQRLANQPQAKAITWKHAAAESTGLPDAMFDLVSACLMFHELPQTASQQVFREAYRLVRPGGYFALMDMNPQSEIYAKMPPYILTLLKSTEPYLDQYFTLDLEAELVKAGFQKPTIVANSPRHRTVVAQKS